MNKHISATIVVGLLCGIIGFCAGRSGMMPKADCAVYQQRVQEGIRDYKRHYFASRTKMTDLFKYLDDREEWFYRDMPNSFKSGTTKPQCVVDLFGNIDKWQADYMERTREWDSQVREIEVHIASAIIPQ